MQILSVCVFKNKNEFYRLAQGSKKLNFPRQRTARVGSLDVKASATNIYVWKQHDKSKRSYSTLLLDRHVDNLY